MFIYYLIAFVAVLMLVPLVRRYAIRHALMDVPNQRSSHTVATPRGGGIAIVLVWFVALIILAYAKTIDLPLALALIIGGAVVALIGYLDDHFSLSARWRILVQALGALIALYCLGGLPQLTLGNWSIHLGLLGYILGMIGIVWAINFYNFMDGIDGLAAGEAVFVSLAAGLLLSLNHAQVLASICWLLAAVNAGFLVWNWPPAKIFMGDISSGLLGFNFAVLLIASNATHSMPTISWLILLAVFICDSTFTLLRRIWQREPWYLPHRTHAYQRLVQSGRSHGFVTSITLFFNILILLPLAYLAMQNPSLAVFVLLIVVLLLLLIWYTIPRTARSN